MKLNGSSWLFTVAVLVLLACVITNTVVNAVHGGH